MRSSGIRRKAQRDFSVRAAPAVMATLTSATTRITGALLLPWVGELARRMAGDGDVE